MTTIDRGKVDALVARAHREVDEGLLPSCQLAVAKDGELVATETIGDASAETRYVAFSCTKAFVASAMWVLIGEGLVDVAAKVSDVIPEFATNGKDVVTIEQVMLHTSGFPHAPLGPPEWCDRARRVERFSQWRLNWDPGTATEYHPTSAHWVLAEIIERAAGIDYRDFVADRVTAPLGLPRVLGLPVEDQQGMEMAQLVEVGAAPTSAELEAILGVPALDMGEVTNEALMRFNEPANKAVGVPGAGGVMRASDLALFYQALLANPGGLWDAGVLADATTRVRNTYPDPMTGAASNRSLGLVIAGDDGKSHLRANFGRTVSARAFGHSGAAGQIAWADPATGLSFAYVTNGIDRNVIREHRRSVALSSIAGICAA